MRPRPALSLRSAVLSALCGALLAASASASCLPDASHLCLQGGRFAVQVRWSGANGQTGAGSAVQLTPDTGYFYFFSPENIELITKLLDGRGLNGHFWFFYGGLSDLRYVITVTDTPHHFSFILRLFQPASTLT